MNFDADIWPQVQRDAWKYRRRTAPASLIIIHTTRSGIPGRSAEQEYGSTKNWFLSPGNMIQGVTERFAGMASYIVGGGKMCRVLPEDRYPTYSLGHGDPIGFSIEIGQNLAETPIEDRDLENAALIAADLMKRYSIDARMLAWLSGDNREAPGIARHDRSDNGRRLGKSDPGPMFDEAKFVALVRGYMEEDEMASQEYEELKKAQEDMRRFFAGVVTNHEERLDDGGAFHDGIAVYVGEIAKRQRDHEGRIKKIETTE